MQQNVVVFKAMTSIFSQSNELSMKDQEIIENHLRLVFAAGFDEGRKQTAHGKAVVQYRDGIEIARFEDINTAAKFYGLCKSTISKAVSGKIKKCLDSDWMLEKDVKLN